MCCAETQDMCCDVTQDMCCLETQDMCCVEKQDMCGVEKRDMTQWSPKRLPAQQSSEMVLRAPREDTVKACASDFGPK